MFQNGKDNRFGGWFPGQTQTRDRWGDPVGAELKAREFQAGGSTPGAAERMRWSLGHA